MSKSVGFTDSDIISINQKLLDAILSLNYETYSSLMAEDIVAIERESNNMPVHGLSFHKYFFDLFSTPSMAEKNKTIMSNTVSMANPHVRWLGNGCCSDGCGEGSAAIITYIRLDQSMAEGDEYPTVKTCTETRVWENRDGK